VKTAGAMTILDGPLRDEALRLWRMFENHYGSVGVQTFAHPNLTFGGGTIRDPRALAAHLEDLAETLEPFELRITGIDVFHEPQRAVYLAVEPTAELTRIHRSVHQVLEQHCEALVELYRPESWVPHITVAMGDLSQENFERALEDLSNYEPRPVQLARQISLDQSKTVGSGFEVFSRWNVGSRGMT
jgi:2'-5' RNA ligase